MMSFRYSVALTAAFVALLGGGCSFLNSKEETLAINVFPHDAVVYVNADRLTGAPLFVNQPRNRAVLISASLPPTEAEPCPQQHYFRIERQLNTHGVLDAIGAVALLPALGLFSGGSREFAVNNVVINLYDPVSADNPALSAVTPTPAPAPAELGKKDDAARRAKP